jgi:hypothetical protein
MNHSKMANLINIFLSIEYQDFVDYGFTINFYKATLLQHLFSEKAY